MKKKIIILYMTDTIINIKLLCSGKQFTENKLVDSKLKNNLILNKNIKLDLFYDKSISGFSNTNR